MTIVRNFSPSSAASSTPADGSVTNVKVATNAAISADKLVDGTTNKIMTSGERTKLVGIAAGATVYFDENAQDAAASLLTSGAHSGISFAYDDTNNRVNATVTSGGGGPATGGTSPVTWETWTGTNGAVWPAQWTTTGTTADIQSNAGRHLTPATANARIDSKLAGEVSDGQLLCKWQMDSTGVQRFVEFHARQADTNNFYSITTDNANTSLYIMSDGNLSVLAGPVAFVPAANTWYWTRFQWAGTRFLARWWADGLSEPTAWSIDATSNTFSVGQVVLASANGSAATARTTSFDDLQVWSYGGSGLATIPASTKTSSYTLVLADAGDAVEVNTASASTLTVPLSSSVSFPIGTVIEIVQLGAGQVTIAGAGGVALRSASGLRLRTQYSVASIRKSGADTWVVSGDVVI